MAEHLQKIAHNYTSAEKDGLLQKWSIVSYSTEDENIDYISGQKIVYWVNVPSPGNYSILGNRSDGTRHFDISSCVKMKVDGQTIDNSLTHEFTESGIHKVLFKSKFSDFSMDRFKDEVDGLVTVAPIVKLDLSRVHSENINSMHCMLQYCKSLAHISDLSRWDTSNITNMVCAFEGCVKVPYIGDLTNWDTSKVENMEGMFEGCENLVSVGDLSNWCLSACTSIGYMFNDCSSLTYIGDLSNWDVSKITDMSYLFDGCSSEQFEGIGKCANWDVSNVENMYEMFYTGHAYKQIDFSKWNVSKCTSFYWMFAGYGGGYDGLPLELDFSNWQFANGANVEMMFGENHLITSLDLSNWDTTNLTGLNTIFGHIWSPAAYNNYSSISKVKLGKGYFNNAMTTYYFGSLKDWTADSIYESLYTNQVGRDTSNVKTINIQTEAYNRLTDEQKSNISSLGFNLVSVAE